MPLVFVISQPAGVNQPAFEVVGADAFVEQIGIHRRVKHVGKRAEATVEYGVYPGNGAGLRIIDLRGISTQKMIASLFGRKL